MTESVPGFSETFESRPSVGSMLLPSSVEGKKDTPHRIKRKKNHMVNQRKSDVRPLITLNYGRISFWMDGLILKSSMKPQPVTL